MLTCIFALVTLILQVVGSINTERNYSKVTSVLLKNTSNIGNIQIEIDRLKHELVLMSIENQKLDAEVKILVLRVAKLQEQATCMKQCGRPSEFRELS